MRGLCSILQPGRSCIPGLLFLGMLHVSPGLLCGQYSRADCPSCKTWNQPQEPFKIYGNTYYVGTHGLSSILITSSAGHLLIDGALPESVEQIRDHIRALGFRIEDVKLIVNSHVHFDHAGGIAALQHWSHARVAASQWSANVLRKGGVAKGDPQYGLLPDIAKVRDVERIDDEEVLRVGEVEITTHLTPGHTPGGTSWTWKSCEHEQCLNLVYADSLTAVSAPDFKFASHPDALRGFEKSFAFLERTPCDILITPHPDVSGLWSRLERRNQGAKPDPMVDRTACRNLADNGREQLRKRVQSESSR
jgi:metallo-beta-lactamase class B